MLFSEKNCCFYYENHKEHTNIFCVQNAEFWYVEACGTYNIYWVLKG
jgi:hypothetical protein